MKLRLAAATVAVAALTSVPLTSAAPGGNGNGKPVSPPGQTISAVAKNGGAPVGVLTTLTGLRPYSRGLPNALAHVTVNHGSPTP